LGQSLPLIHERIVNDYGRDLRGKYRGASWLVLCGLVGKKFLVGS